MHWIEDRDEKDIVDFLRTTPRFVFKQNEKSYYRDLGFNENDIMKIEYHSLLELETVMRNEKTERKELMKKLIVLSIKGKNKKKRAKEKEQWNAAEERKGEIPAYIYTF